MIFRKFTSLLVIVLLLSFFSFFSMASEHSVKKVNNDIRNVASLRNGFDTFVKNCVSCHSAKLIRYSRIAQDLELNKSELDKYMFGAGVNENSMILTKMKADDAIKIFGLTPPDLSLIARVKGPDWIYTYLKSFYVDSTKKFHTDNHLFVGTAMPNVLGSFQGLFNKDGSRSTSGTMSEKEYNAMVTDLVNFMVYIAEPIQARRLDLGVKVIAFLLFVFFLFYLLKREYWQDIKKSH